MTSNGVGLDRLAAPGRRRTRPGQRQPRHHGPTALRQAHPARPPRGRHRGSGSRRGRRAHPVRSMQSRCVDSTTWTLLTFSSGVLTAATSCASSSRCRSTRNTTGTAARWSPRTSCSRGWAALHPDGARAWQCRPALPGGRWTGHCGIIASVTAPFCAACDRSAAHRRRATAQLPLRSPGGGSEGRSAKAPPMASWAG